VTRITGTLHEDQNTFLITSRSVRLRLRHVSDNSLENTKRPIVRSRTFRKSCRLWDNVEK